MGLATHCSRHGEDLDPSTVAAHLFRQNISKGIARLSVHNSLVLATVGWMVDLRATGLDGWYEEM
eukprot:scaffold26307_cov318-Cylindrotheca_fusiformis.AAC.1